MLFASYILAASYFALSIFPRSTLQSSLAECLAPVKPMLSFPSDPNFTGYENFNLNAAATPLAVFYPRGSGDVAKSISCCQQLKIPCTARSGGHGYEGYAVQEGLLLNLKNLASVTANGSVATIGAGATLGQIYTDLWTKYKVTIPGGSCPSVGIGGHAQGGGYGMISRKFGLVSDRITEFEIVLANGVLAKASSTSNKDIFWAVRGGGGGNFGIVTKFTISAVSFPNTIQATGFTWPKESRLAVLQAFQQKALSDPDSNITFNLLVTGNAVNLNIVNLGTGATSNFINVPGSKPTYTRSTDNYLDIVKLFSGGTDRESFKAKSGYAFEPISDRGLQVILENLDATPSGGYVILDPYGGEISKFTGAALSSFAHRKALYCIQYTAQWYSSGQKASSLSWISNFQKTLQPFISPFAYVNYIDKDHPNWLNAYHGASVARLVQVKKTVDPTNFFKFPQSIPLAV